MVTDLTRLSDGTYGRELGRVSPEGNIYGTTRWVRDVLRNFWWNGARWLEIGEDIGQSNSVQLLPTDPQDPDTVWRCLDRIEDGKYIWKYFFWDAISQSWQPIVWHWTVESYQELPNNPWFRGQAHEVKEPDVLAMWDGFTWRRLRISSFDDDIGLSSGVIDLTNTTHQLQQDHNGLLESFFGFQETVNYAFLSYDQELEDIDEAISDLQGGWDDATSGRMLTATEAHSLNLMWIQVSGEAEDIIDLAEALETESTPDLTTAKNNYVSALSQLETQINRWINLAEYPVEILEADRDLLAAAIQNEAQKRATLVSMLTNQKIEITKVEIDEEIGEVNSALGDVETKLNNTLSDEYITKDEAKSLQLAFARLDSECGDILEIGILLELTLQVTNLDNALVALEAKIVSWASLDSYPSEITPQQRADITTAFSLVETYIVALNSAITQTQTEASATDVREFVSEELQELDSAVGDLSTLANNMLSDNYITLAEANSLKLALTQVRSESADIIAIANANGITTEKINYQNAVTALNDAIFPWVDQTAYPIAISTEQRQVILEAIEDVYAAKTILRNAITTQLDTGVSELISGIINEEVEDLNGSISNLSDNIDTLLSDAVITFIEANTLKISWVQVESESADIVALATSIGVTAATITAYSVALNDLETILDGFLDQEIYPIEVTTQQRQNIADCFAAVQATKATLLNAIEVARIESTIDYINQQVSELDSAISGMYNAVFAWVPGESVSSGEAEDIETRLQSLNTEISDVIAIATAVGITTEKTALSDSLDDLTGLLSAYIDQVSYPVTLTSQDQQDILDAITDIRSKKTLILDAISEKRLADLYDYIDDQIGDVNEAVEDLDNTLDNISSDEFITMPEAQSLNLALVRLESEADDLIYVAGNLNLGIAGAFDCGGLFGDDVVVIDGGSDINGVETVLSNELTTEATEFDAAISALRAAVSPWINQAAYPIAITAVQRDAFTAAFAAVEDKRAALVSAIESYKDIDISDYANDRILDLIDSNDETSELLRQISSDGYLTYDESISLQLQLITLNGECETLIDIAELLGDISTSEMESALASLAAAVNPWINLTNYPAAILSTDRTAIENAYLSVQVAKTQLADAITKARDDKIIVDVQDQIDDINEAAGDLSELVENSLSDSYISAIEAQTLRTSLHTLQSEANDVIVLATATGIAGLISLADALDSSLDALALALAPFIDGETAYPRSVTAQQRDDINDAFADVQSKKTALIDALAQAKADGAYTDASFDLSEFQLIYNGFVRGFTPEFELAYISENELTLRPRYSDYDYLTISEQNIQASKRTSVFTFSPVLNWNSETESLYYSTLQPSTEYWVYLANRSAGFALNVYDFRGRLFCSNTEPSNNYLGLTGLGLNAILIGKCETSASTKFLYELDVSLVSRTSDLRETFREFSDFDLTYTNETTLTLTRTYGTYGQMYIPEALYYLGENRVLLNTDKRISYGEEDGLLSVDSNDIESNTLYYCYIAGDTDIFNFNEINPNTGLPWHPEDSGAGDGVTGPYYSDIDFRLRMFLSTKTPEEGRLAETWRAYWARHIGQVRVDGVGKFIYSSNVSSIRQATLNPSYFDGLAELTLQYVSTSEMRIIRRKGSSGIIMVGGVGIQLFNSDDTNVHKVHRDSTIYNYTEANPLSPLSSTATQVKNYTTVPVYIYIANNRPCWGTLAGQVFCSLKSPVDAYLSNNYPGNNARWVATLDVDTTGYFTGSYVVDSINQPMLVIDDVNVSPNTLWSSHKNQQSMMAYYNQLASLISAQNTYTVQQSNGISVRLEYVNKTTVRLVSVTGNNVNVVMPNLTVVTVPSTGVYLTISGTPNIRYYVYLNSNGTLSMTTSGPDNLYTKLETRGTTQIQVGDICMTGYNSMTGDWNICSSHNEISKRWAYPAYSGWIDYTGTITLANPMTCLVASRRSTATVTRTGGTQGVANYENSLYTGSFVQYGTYTDSWGYAPWSLWIYVRITQVGMIGDITVNNERTISLPSITATMQTWYSTGSIGIYFYGGQFHAEGEFVITR